jgi:hypothetical protein
MYIGVNLFYVGSLFGPLFFWSAAAITGALGAAFIKYPPHLPTDFTQPLPPPKPVEEAAAILEEPRKLEEAPVLDEPPALEEAPGPEDEPGA